ncbi:tRNA pseudouridine(38-40) synthase TruA [Evansella sp. AB-P1]|uniref:tRNA pseudouridine(38-40) synthase TruA n=1 Tax=Evansella sp. AB-P1 TaxID=3037653 RepID=UPI00241E1CA2|nr:tRNA pseudouridine(38-40) synthase TruA [Evansella sp. AB-P1]MDG5788083.1 tRNA pseudouridine(38-40) synthase TruA [Evansella sp. AB-P1]
MQRIKAIISYDGTNFSGYQVQPNKRTVQGEFEKALAKMHKVDDWKVYGSGRTDAGVHGVGQTIHYDTPLSIPEERWPQALNSILPEDILVRHVTYVDSNFQARYDAVGKEYIYRVYTNKIKNVFDRHYKYHHPVKLSYNDMMAGAKLLEGKHDFTSFSSPKTTVKEKTRTLFSATIERDGDDWTFRYIGSGFLYQMVRIITGTLLDVGTGKLAPYRISEILEAKNRFEAGLTIPGNGLYLVRVFYKEKELQKAIEEARGKNN